MLNLTFFGTYKYSPLPEVCHLPIKMVKTMYLSTVDGFAIPFTSMGNKVRLKEVSLLFMYVLMYFLQDINKKNLSQSMNNLCKPAPNWFAIKKKLMQQYSLHDLCRTIHYTVYTLFGGIFRCEVCINCKVIPLKKPSNNLCIPRINNQLECIGYCQKGECKSQQTIYFCSTRFCAQENMLKPNKDVMLIPKNLVDNYTPETYTTIFKQIALLFPISALVLDFDLMTCYALGTNNPNIPKSIDSLCKIIKYRNRTFRENIFQQQLRHCILISYRPISPIRLISESSFFFNMYILSLSLRSSFIFNSVVQHRHCVDLSIKNEIDFKTMMNLYHISHTLLESFSTRHCVKWGLSDIICTVDFKYLPNSFFAAYDKNMVNNSYCTKCRSLKYMSKTNTMFLQFHSKYTKYLAYSALQWQFGLELKTNKKPNKGRQGTSKWKKYCEVMTANVYKLSLECNSLIWENMKIYSFPKSDETSQFSCMVQGKTKNGMKYTAFNTNKVAKFSIKNIHFKSYEWKGKCTKSKRFVKNKVAFKYPQFTACEFANQPTAQTLFNLNTTITSLRVGIVHLILYKKLKNQFKDVRPIQVEPKVCNTNTSVDAQGLTNALLMRPEYLKKNLMVGWTRNFPALNSRRNLAVNDSANISLKHKVAGNTNSIQVSAQWHRSGTLNIAGFDGKYLADLLIAEMNHVSDICGYRTEKNEMLTALERRNRQLLTGLQKRFVELMMEFFRSDFNFLTTNELLDFSKSIVTHGNITVKKKYKKKGQANNFLSDLCQLGVDIGISDTLKLDQCQYSCGRNAGFCSIVLEALANGLCKESAEHLNSLISKCQDSKKNVTLVLQAALAIRIS